MSTLLELLTSVKRTILRDAIFTKSKSGWNGEVTFAVNLHSDHAVSEAYGNIRYHDVKESRLYVPAITLGSVTSKVNWRTPK